MDNQFFNDAVLKAVAFLKSKELVAFPTETVYGLGGIASCDEVVQKIYTIKGRPSYNPLIVHVSCLEAAQDIGTFNERALFLAKQFWPGPLTLVVPLKKTANISFIARAGLSTVAIRVPSHLSAQAVLKKLEAPIVAPSANLSGYLSSTHYDHVYKNLHDKIAYILPNTHHFIGLESTIIDCTQKELTLLRPGFITAEDLNIYQLNLVLPADNRIKAPGATLHHYAPNLPIRLNATFPLNDQEAFLNFGHFTIEGFKKTLQLSEKADLNEAAYHLFSFLHILDQPDIYKAIAVAPIPDQGIGRAINDRLKRAAQPKI